MKTLSFLPLLTLVFALTTTNAQKVKMYKIWVTTVNQDQFKGTLHAANQDELVILGENFTELKFVPENIQGIKVRRQGKVGKGAWMGAVSGAVIGAVIGFSSTEDAYITQGGGALFGGLIGGSVGTLFGAVIKSGREKILINGNKDAYLSLLPRLQQYAPQKVFD
jgi:hypothetical protein